MSGSHGYNGWKNWETWNVALWVDSEYGLYQLKCELFANGDEPIMGEQVQRFVDDYMSGKTPDMENHREMCPVDWDEIAENWETERQEWLEYQ